MTGPKLDLGPLLADNRTKIVVTCGSGGVGKTTTAAAMALWAADAGPQGGGADHRPGASGWPSRSAWRNWTTTRGGSTSNSPATPASCGR